MTYREIRAVVPVPKGTLSSWVSDVAMTDEVVEAKAVRTAQIGLPRDTQRLRRAQVELIHDHALASAATLHREALWMAGVALYWGEGAKTERRLSITNSDVGVLKIFKAWCQQYLDPDARFSCMIHIHHATQLGIAQTYWSEELGVSEECFTKPYLKKAGTGHRTVLLPHGILRMTLRESADAWVTAMAWVEWLKNNNWYTSPHGV